ncbi:LAGLIDADG family homing endonuclease [Robertmurraya siralis]|uniref:LAGLIDADG family homing endonuclease n=1 Tax=Robertmurraya siralis TaxID=77777 RepID=UPI0014772EDA|nr:LAGLIDADG family homing endonuclease [Robertmurraya siralis]
MQSLDYYDKALVENRDMQEANFIFCLWKNPDLYHDYEKEVRADRDLLTPDGRFYYTLGFEMFQKGYKSFDDASIYSYIEDKEVLKNGFARRGGYKTVDEIKRILNEENVETYYDELVKSNMLLSLHDKGFNVIKELSKFKKMTSSQVYDYFEYQLDNVFLGRGSGVKIEDLDFEDGFIESVDSGEEMGLSYASAAPLLNYHTLGIHRSNVQIFGGFSGTGKAQDLDSKIMTPNGYVKMRDVKVGDEIFGEDGKIHRILGVYPQGKKDMYEITFSDGSKTITCDEHLWNVQNPTLRTKGEFKTVTLKQIMEEGLYKIYKGKNYKTWIHYIPMTKPLQFKTNNKLNLPPYLLGMIISEANLNSSSVVISINNEETDLVDYLNEYCVSNNIHLVINEKRDGVTDYRFTKNKGMNTNHLKNELRRLGLHPTLSDTKFIPKDYLYSNVEDRIELLSGLIDTDGEVNGSNYSYSTTSKGLAEDVQFLVQSLGGTAKIEIRETHYPYKGEKRKGKPSFRLHIKMPREIKAFKSKKHKCKFREGQTTSRRSIRNIKYIGKREAQCISTSNPTKLYLTDDMIVTHNTSFCINTYILPILDRGEKVTIIANEMNRRAWQHILMATILSQKLDYYGLPRKKQKMGHLNDEQKEKMEEAREYFNKHYKGRVKFAKIYDYSIDDVKRIIRKMSKQGFGYALYDTFKAGNSAAEQVRGELIEASKQLLQVAEKEDVGIIITMQLAIYMENTRYLTAATLSDAKGVKEVVSELVLTRPIWEDEFKGCKYDIKPYRFKKDSNGKFTNIKEEIVLKPDKKYRLVFLDKTRNDEGEIVLLYQFDGAWNKWIELGYCTPKHQR